MYLLKPLFYALALVSTASTALCAPASLASPELIARGSSTFTDAQHALLNKSYAFNKFIVGRLNKDRLDALVENTKLSRKQVVKWFVNKRLRDELKQRPKPTDTPAPPPPPQPAAGPSSQPLVSLEASSAPLISADLTLAPLPDGPPLPVTEILPLSESGKARNLAKSSPGAGAGAGMRNLKSMNRSPKPRSGSPMNRNPKATSRTPKSTGKNLKSTTISPKSNGSTRSAKAQQKLSKQNLPTPSSKSKPKRGAMAKPRPKSKPKARRRV
ncbi:hypothetical protein FA13DRAFT_1802195 [Coprinellus micaceus]|uniref:Homeobox domain-containing protein n=1 Tax=Coprinellus micaceus TaxID=71717 RepID=A0A4Y7SCS7_COPMI|nr:hypothetical protein FA13DRAFT_1802195 [Coprinellus micaceus]